MRSWIICVGVLLAGCGSAPKKTEGLKQVSGTVTYKGQPVTKGVITFVTGEPKGISASGSLDATGKYVLRSDVNSPGARPGAYKVRIESWLTEPGMTGGKFTPGKAGIPEKYFSVEKSTLTATVAGDKDPQVFDFDLKD